MVKDLSKLSRGERAEYVTQLQAAKRKVEADLAERKRLIRHEQKKIEEGERRLREIDQSINHLL